MSDWLEGSKSCTKCAYSQLTAPPYANSTSPPAPQVAICRYSPPISIYGKVAQPVVDEVMWCYQFKAKVKE